MTAPRAVAEAVERYVADELADEQKYENRSPLDESGIWALHALAARVYEIGFNAGREAEEVRARGRHRRAVDKERS